MQWNQVYSMFALKCYQFNSLSKCVACHVPDKCQEVFVLFWSNIVFLFTKATFFYLITLSYLQAAYLYVYTETIEKYKTCTHIQYGNPSFPLLYAYQLHFPFYIICSLVLVVLNTSWTTLYIIYIYNYT